MFYFFQCFQGPISSFGQKINLFGWSSIDLSLAVLGCSWLHWGAEYRLFRLIGWCEVCSGLNRETHLGVWVIEAFSGVVLLRFWGGKGGLGKEMNGQGEERTAFEIGVVVPKRAVKERDESFDCVEVLVEEFKQAGLIVEKVIGIADEFIKVWFCSYLCNVLLRCIFSLLLNFPFSHLLVHAIGILLCF